MDSNLIDFESMLAARDAADWAFWTMVVTMISVIVTFFATVIAILSIKGWKRHEEANEIKNLRVAAYNFHTSLIRLPLTKSVELAQSDWSRIDNAYSALSNVYVATLMMHDVKTRGLASNLYSEFADIFGLYTSGEINNEEAGDKVMIIRMGNKLLSLSS